MEADATAMDAAPDTAAAPPPDSEPRTDAEGSGTPVTSATPVAAAPLLQPWVNIAVEFDRQVLRADFSMGGHVLPVMVPLAEIWQYLVGSWVTDAGATTVRLWVQLRNGEAFRVLAIGASPGREPELRMDSVHPNARLDPY